MWTNSESDYHLTDNPIGKRRKVKLCLNDDTAATTCQQAWYEYDS